MNYPWVEVITPLRFEIGSAFKVAVDCDAQRPCEKQHYEPSGARRHTLIPFSS
jgi:hypothetical protein